MTKEKLAENLKHWSLGDDGNFKPVEYGSSDPQVVIESQQILENGYFICDLFKSKAKK